MSIQEVIELVNEAVEAGVIDQYAIGGAVAVTFYIEPVSTVDVDVFVAFQPEPGEWLVNPKRVYDFFVQRGGVIEGEFVVIADWPVQFLPPTGPLVEEAIGTAVIHHVGGTPARVFSIEHLMAICLQTGRNKDISRLVQIIDTGRFDRGALDDILARFSLADAWCDFKRKFPS